MDYNIKRDGKETDIAVFVMGLTGAGKSTFINTVLGRQLMKVGSGVGSCTTQPCPTVIDPVPGFPNLEGRRLVLVDTPGFDDCYNDDEQILTRIAGSLENTYRKKMFPGGIIYLHDISIRQFSSAAQYNLEMFSRLCGNDAIRKVALVTTSSDSKGGEERERELQVKHWKAMIEQGAKVHRFLRDEESAWEVINSLLQNIDADHKQTPRTYFQLQRELVDRGMSIRRTEAGKYLNKVGKKRKNAQARCTVQ